MHLLGAAIRLELNPGTPRARVLLDIPRWDFHWQNAYTLATPVTAGRATSSASRAATTSASGRTGSTVPERASVRPLGRGHDRRDVPGHPAGDARVGVALRILLVSQMYPGPDDPDLGVFVANLERELAARGHELERAVVDERAGGGRRHARARVGRRPGGTTLPPGRHLRPLPRARRARRRARVTGAARRHGARPGREERRLDPGRGTATRYVVRRAAAIVAVSDWLRVELERAVPEAAGKVEVVDCGVDLERFAPRDALAAREEVGCAPDGTSFLCLGALSERKNVLRLARHSSAGERAH